MSDVSDLTPVVMWFCLIAGSICFLAGGIVAILVAIKQRSIVDEAEKAVKSAVASHDKVGQDGIKQQSQASNIIDSVAKLAVSMKDLDVGTRILLVGVVLYGIASVAAGLDAIGSGIAK